MKKIKIKKVDPSGVSERGSETVRSMMNLPAVINALNWPDDVVMALVHSCYFDSDIEGDQLMIDANQVLELEAKIEYHLDLCPDLKGDGCNV